MATFYVFPSRHALGQRQSEMLAALFPGLISNHRDWPELAESLASLVEGHGTAFVVYQEDLDETLGVKESLLRHCGADAADEVVEVPPGCQSSNRPRQAA